MIQVRALTVAGLWIVASVAATPLQADEAAKPAPESTAGQGEEASRQHGETAINGEELFAGVCGFCHADGGRKASKGPKLAGSARSDEFIINRIKHGKQGRMPAFGGTFSDEQIEQILAYIRGLEP